MLELFHDLLDFILSIHFNLKVVTCVGQIGRHNEESLINFIKRDRHFKLLVWSLSILFVFTNGYGHLPDIMWLICKLDICLRSLLRSTRTLISLCYILLHRVSWNFIDATGWVST